jgi:hypothetical protein
MHHSLLREYVPLYEWALPYVGGILSVLVCVLFATLSVVVIWAGWFDSNSIGFLALNIAVILLVLST